MLVSRIVQFDCIEVLTGLHWDYSSIYHCSECIACSYRYATKNKPIKIRVFAGSNQLWGFLIGPGSAQRIASPHVCGWSANSANSYQPFLCLCILRSSPFSAINDQGLFSPFEVSRVLHTLCSSIPTVQEYVRCSMMAPPSKPLQSIYLGMHTENGRSTVLIERNYPYESPLTKD